MKLLAAASILAVLVPVLEGSGMMALAAEPRYVWQKVTGQAAFTGRDGAGALVYDNKMWLIGGWNPSDKTDFPKITSNEVWNSVNGADWTRVKPNTYAEGVFNPANDWEGRHTAGYVVYDGKMWIVGGDANQGHYQNDVWNSADGVNWTRVADLVPWGPRVLHHTLVFDNKIWVMGGQTLPQFAQAPQAHYADIWNSSDGVHWEQVRTQGPIWTPRGAIGGSAVFKGRMWIIGGGTYWTPDTPQVLYNDVWSSADGVHWKQETPQAPWAARKYHEVAVFDNKLWILGGCDLKDLQDVWYSGDGANWTEVPNTPWAARHAQSVYVYDDALWMTAGDNMQTDVWKLTVESGR